MKIIMTALAFISLNINAYELCNDKNVKDLGSIEYIYPFEDQSSIDYQPLDLNLIDKVNPTSIKLKLVNFDRFKGGKKVARDLNSAKNILEDILASTAFKTRIYQHKYNGKYQFKKNRGKSNQEIYQIILDGADKYDTRIDNQLDVILCPWYKNKRTIGYTYSNRKEIWINFKYFRDRYNNFGVPDMVGNMIHEWLHNANFSHSSKNNRTRKKTVPYGVGYIARDIASRLD